MTSRTIRVSDEAWIQIAKRRKFGERPDSVLQQVFHMLEHLVESNEETRSRMARRERLSHEHVRRRSILLRK